MNRMLPEMSKTVIFNTFPNLYKSIVVAYSVSISSATRESVLCDAACEKLSTLTDDARTIFTNLPFSYIEISINAIDIDSVSKRFSTF